MVAVSALYAGAARDVAVQRIVAADTRHLAKDADLHAAPPRKRRPRQPRGIRGGAAQGGIRSQRTREKFDAAFGRADFVGVGAFLGHSRGQTKSFKTTQ